jgi:hypothetical protein
MVLNQRQYYKLDATQKVAYSFLKESENSHVDYYPLGFGWKEFALKQPTA